MFNFAAVSGYGAACLYGLLAVLLIAGHGGRAVGRRLIAASLISSAWLGLQGAYNAELGSAIPLTAIHVGETVRDAAWFLFLGALLTKDREGGYCARLRIFVGVLVGLCVLAAAVLFAPSFIPGGVVSHRALHKMALFTLLVLAIGGVLLVEQLFRNAHADARWAIKHLCFGVGAIFAYDFFLYADAALFNRVNPDIWAARAAVNAMAVPMVALAAARNRQWDLKLFVSRRVVFHSTAVVAAGLYLLLMALAGYYFKAYGGTWGGALRIAFSFGALLFLVALVFSVQLRSRLRMFLAKHFYQNKYEYGEVWLNFTRQLSEHDTDPATLRQTILKAIAEIMDSTGGAMWQKDASGNFSLAAAWNMEATLAIDLTADERMVRDLGLHRAVIDIHAVAGGTATQAASGLPGWVLGLARAWIVVPVMHSDELIAFLILAESRSNAEITWEDRELLRTVGRQAGSYLALLRAGEALSEVRQFEAFNRLSAFLVHDLKNVVAQLSLIVRNAERHRDNPDFIADAFNTIGDSIAKMNRMMATLRQDQAGAEQGRQLDMNEMIAEVVARRRDRMPQPHFEPGTGIHVRANRDQMLSVLEHLVQNAQEATPADGSVIVRLSRHDDRALVEITDSGCGMDREFVRHRLFKPFDTTKGKAGMGIGAYESRHIVETMGGNMTVESVPGMGTTFRISLPIVDDRHGGPAVQSEP